MKKVVGRKATSTVQLRLKWVGWRGLREWSNNNGGMLCVYPATQHQNTKHTAPPQPRPPRGAKVLHARFDHPSKADEEAEDLKFGESLESKNHVPRDKKCWDCSQCFNFYLGTDKHSSKVQGAISPCLMASSMSSLCQDSFRQRRLAAVLLAFNPHQCD
jgi:hypothetical protein